MMETKFDANDIRLIIKDYLRDNLSIKLNKNTQYDYGIVSSTTTVKLFLGGECFSEYTLYE